MQILMVPGIGGSDERHWQTIWQRELGPHAQRISPASWDAPDANDWVDCISRMAGADTVIVAHSLGCLAAATWLTESGSARPRGAFLVAPPDPSAPTFPAAANSFSAPRTALPVPSVVLASSTDPFSSLEVAARRAHDWRATFVDVGPLGHINSESRLGGWPDGRRRLQTFLDLVGSSKGEGAADDVA